MKVNVVVEEIITQKFEIEANETDSICDQIREMYENKKLVLDKPSLSYASAYISNVGTEEPEWIGLV